MDLHPIAQLIEDGLRPFLAGGAVFGPLGLLIGHRLQLGRERRKEYNEAVDPVRKRLLRQLENPTPMTRTEPTRDELDRLRPHLGWLQRQRVCRAIQRHQECASQCQARGASGHPHYTDVRAIKATIAALLAMLPRR